METSWNADDDDDLPGDSDPTSTAGTTQCSAEKLELIQGALKGKRRSIDQYLASIEPSKRRMRGKQEAPKLYTHWYELVWPEYQWKRAPEVQTAASLPGAPQLLGQSKLMNKTENICTKWPHTKTLYPATYWYFSRLTWEREGEVTWHEIALDFELSTSEELNDWCPKSQTYSPAVKAADKASCMRRIAHRIERMFRGYVAPWGTIRKAGSLTSVGMPRVAGARGRPNFLACSYASVLSQSLANAMIEEVKMRLELGSAAGGRTTPKRSMRRWDWHNLSGKTTVYGGRGYERPAMHEKLWGTGELIVIEEADKDADQSMPGASAWHKSTGTKGVELTQRRERGAAVKQDRVEAHNSRANELGLHYLTYKAPDTRGMDKRLNSDTWMKTYLTCSKCGAYGKFQFQKHIYRDICDPKGKLGRHIQDPKYTYVRKNDEDRKNRKGLRKSGSRRELQDAKKAAKESYGEKRCAVCAKNKEEAFGDKPATWRNQRDLRLVYCHKC